MSHKYYSNVHYEDKKLSNNEIAWMVFSLTLCLVAIWFTLFYALIEGLQGKLPMQQKHHCNYSNAKVEQH